MNAGYVSYGHKPIKCDTYWFTTATTFARTHINITLYVQCLSCLSLRVTLCFC